MFKTIGIVIVAAIAAVLLYAATRPDSFRVERTATISAPPEAVFAEINDFREWRAWSPYERLDPAMKRTYSGAPAGTGAVYEWAGNRNIGKGRMQITGATPPRSILIKLDFVEPIEAHNTATFTLEPVPEGTRVTWSMQGPSPYLSKLIGLFVDMDTMIGGDFEKGLANLETVLTET